MSNRSSLCSESAASELDPLFRSLKAPASNYSPVQFPDSNLSCSACSSADSPLAIPAAVSFPLPPRRLRPGEIVGIQEVEVGDPLATLNTPASLYGVAIGGSNPTKVNPTSNGRAEVQTDGLTSLDLRKMTLRSLQQPNFRRSSEMVNLRARNPSKMLPPHNLTLQSTSRYYINLQSSNMNPQDSSGSVSTLPRDSMSMATQPLPRSRDLSRPPRNHSFFESATNPIPRLPSTRLAYQSLSYHLSNSCELPGQTLRPIQQPLDEPLSVAHTTSPNPQPSQTDTAPGKDTTNITHNRIKFAPLPNKSSSSALALLSKSSLTDPENARSKHFTKKKPAWMGRWLTPNPTPASKAVSNKPKPEISMPMPQSLIVTGAGPAIISSTVLPTERRSSVNERVILKDDAAKSQRPRSQSFSSTRPTLGMVAGMVQRSPSRSLEETLASGKTLLRASQCVHSPVRVQSLRNLIAQDSATNPNATTSTGHPLLDPSKPESLGATQTSGNNLLESQLIQNTIMPNAGFPSDDLQGHLSSVHYDPVPTLEASSGKIDASSEPIEEKAKIPAGKKKREIRFRNTLELIPDPVFNESLEHATPGPSRTSSESPKLAPQSSHSRDLSKPRATSRNLNLFSHLRKHWPDDSDHDNHFSAAPTHSGQRSHQSNLHSGHSHPSGSTSSKKLPRSHQDADNEENVDLWSRKLAPRINLTFVDLDHHIGSRFSVNTLFREVQKSLPDVIPNEETQSGDSAASDYDPIIQTEMQLTSRKPPEPASEDHTEEKDVTSFTPESPTTSVSMSNPAEMESSHPHIAHSGHESVIEVVRTDGADVVFQMVVPMPSSSVEKTKPAEKQAGVVSQDQVDHSLKVDHPEPQDDLTVISERLVALNASLQAQGAQSTRSETNRKGSSSGHPHTKSTKRNPSISARKTNKVEKWLSNVPSPLTSPVLNVQPSMFELNRSNQLMKVEHDEFETLECPDSPIDRHHIPLRSDLQTHVAPGRT